MSPQLPDYPKHVLRAGREAARWPHPNSNPGFYEFEAEVKHAFDVHFMRDAGILVYSEDNNIPLGVAAKMLEVQVQEAEERVAAFSYEVWGE